MNHTAEYFLEKAQDQRKRERYDESIISCKKCLEIESDNPNGWWFLALNYISLNKTNDSIDALLELTDLAPNFIGGWKNLGWQYLKKKEFEKAGGAFESAASCGCEDLDVLNGLATANRETGHSEKELKALRKIEHSYCLLNSGEFRLGLLLYNKQEYYEALKYWKKSLKNLSETPTVYNIGLCYSSSQISQVADAIDMWRICLKNNPEYQPALKSLAVVLDDRKKHADAVRQYPSSLIPKDQWYSVYISPFKLLNMDKQTLDEGFGEKEIQGFKKRMLQEIELEDGYLPWLDGVCIDKSTAITLADELYDEDKLSFHYGVYYNTPLLNFLEKGEHEHFLISDTSQLDTIKSCTTDKAFSEWLSTYFSSQYNNVLCKAIESQCIPIIRSLLDGRRWVTDGHEDCCFNSSIRMVDRLIESLEELSEKVKINKLHVSSSEIRHALSNGGLLGVINILPIQFRSSQYNLVTIIRNIAINSYNNTGDPEAAKAILTITNDLTFQSPDQRDMLAKDFEQFDGFIAEERKEEAKLIFNNEKWQIIKEGVIKGEHFISMEDVGSIRWGVTISTTSVGRLVYYNFIVKADDDREIDFSWTTPESKMEDAYKHFNALIDAALAYLIQPILSKIEKRFMNGGTVKIGPCQVGIEGVSFKIKGWLSDKQVSVPWIRMDFVLDNNGELTIMDIHEKKHKISFSFVGTDNAPILRYLAYSMKKSDN